MVKFLERAERFARLCERNNCYLGGFAGIDNPIFRCEHYGVNTFADGRAWIVRKGDLRFDLKANVTDDMCWTVRNIQRHGIVIVDKWILPSCSRYTAGGFGSVEQRMDQKIEESAYLVKTYPKYVAFKKKANMPEGSHITLRQQRNKPTLIL
jgi:hypothetical protein